MRLRIFALGVAILALGSPPAPAQTVPDGFAVQDYLTWTGPPFGGNVVGFTLLPDGRPIIIERPNGDVRTGVPGSGATTVIGNVPGVQSTGNEQGLLGVAADPLWPARPYLYFYYTHVSLRAYVTMYEVTGDLTDPASTNLSLANPYFVLTDIPDSAPFHNAGTLRFGPDGMLYVSVGDDGDPCGTQGVTQLVGKILRLDVSSLPGAGTGPPAKADITPASGNPFSGPNDNALLTWEHALRNPFRFTIDPVTGDLAIGDVGLDSYEELNFSDASAPGKNFGWPQREGPDSSSCCGTCGEGNTFTDPIYAYPHSLVSPQAIIPGPIYRPGGGGAAFPAHYDGTIFLLEFYEGWIRRVENDGGWQLAAPVPGQPSSENWGEGFSFASDFQLGPGGELLILQTVGPPRGIQKIVPTAPVGVDVVEAPGVGLCVTASPNPAAGGRAIAIRWQMPRAAEANLRIVDLTGRVVRTIARDVMLPASGTAAWDGRAEDGALVPAGVYFYRLEADGRTASGKLSRLR